MFCRTCSRLASDVDASALRIPGVVEPPELSGEPKIIKKPTPAQQAFMAIIKNFNNNIETSHKHLPELNQFIEELALYYADAYFMRALTVAS